MVGEGEFQTEESLPGPLLQKGQEMGGHCRSLPSPSQSGKRGGEAKIPGGNSIGFQQGNKELRPDALESALQKIGAKPGSRRGSEKTGCVVYPPLKGIFHVEGEGALLQPEIERICRGVEKADDALLDDTPQAMELQKHSSLPPL